jgi:hypothetical protein
VHRFKLRPAAADAAAAPCRAVLDGLPVITPEKVEKLSAVVLKLAGRFGTVREGAPRAPQLPAAPAAAAGRPAGAASAPLAAPGCDPARGSGAAPAARACPAPLPPRRGPGTGPQPSPEAARAPTRPHAQAA